jgi:hypothetical protein
MANMGFDYGLEKSTTCFKTKFRWLFKIPSVSASGIESLPPSKAARPSLSFKELQLEHLNETIYMPGKPDWKPVNLVLYDLKKNKNPVFNWLRHLYDSCNGSMKTPVDNNFYQTAVLELYDGCGNSIETWIFENAWPNSIEFGDLDMSNSDYLTCDLVLRYARAYIEEECFGFEGGSTLASGDFGFEGGSTLASGNF